MYNIIWKSICFEVVQKWKTWRFPVRFTLAKQKIELLTINLASILPWLSFRLMSVYDTG